MDSISTTAKPMRILAEDLKSRIESGEAATILDARGQKAWDESPIKIAGAIRFRPVEFHIDPAWPLDRLTVIY